MAAPTTMNENCNPITVPLQHWLMADRFTKTIYIGDIRAQASSV